MGCTGTETGELLNLAAASFDAFLTADQNLAQSKLSASGRAP